MIRVFNKFEPIPKNYIEIDTTSRGNYKDLSPFYLGPCKWEDPCFKYMKCNIFENLWQYSKVYEQHLSPTNDILPSYYEWRDYGYSRNRAERYPMGKGVKPLFMLWKGNKYSYVDARKVLYIPFYVKLVLKTKSYSMLYNMVLRGDNVALRDFDGYDHISKGVLFEDIINNKNKSLGHAFIIYGLLTGELANYFKITSLRRDL